MIKLDNITLVAMSSIKIFETIKAMKYSMKKIEFKECIFFSHEKPFFLPRNIKFRFITILKCKDDYNYKILFELYKYIRTEYILLIHYDGFVVNPEMWRKDFLDYDYIGPPWPENSIKDILSEKIRVGSGISIRSKKLLELPTRLGLSFNYGDVSINQDDIFICCRYRQILLENGICYAPIEIAKFFGHELMIPEIQGIKPFVFHKWKGSNKNYKKFYDPVKTFKFIIKLFIPFGYFLIRDIVRDSKRAIQNQ